MEFDMAFEKTAAAIEELKAARDRVVAEFNTLNANSAAAANLTAEAAAADESTAAAIADVTGSLNGLIPPAQ
jgi:hypothetical protein